LRVLIAVLLATGFVLDFSRFGTVSGPAGAWAQDHSAHGVAAPAKTKPTAREAAPAAPRAGESDEVAPQVEIGPDRMQFLGVKTATASYQPLRKTIRTVGRFEYDERRLATVNTKIEGWIETLYVDYTGRSVKKGEALVEIYSPELVATQQEFLNVLAWTKRRAANDDALGKQIAGDAESLLEAARRRLRLWDISDEQIRKIAETGKPVRTLTLFSPVDGTVIQKMAVAGMRVMPGEKLFDVADLSVLWLIADVYEYELPLIRVGQEARIRLSYFPGREFVSRVEYIYPTISPDTRTGRVRLSVSNEKDELKPQMYADVEFRIDLGRRLAVPDSAVIDTGTGQVVYVDRGEGNFEPREVLTGVRADGVVEILKGLRSGDKVAASGNFLIDSEAQLKGVKPLRTQ
jgi:Cu(I)/Ag(I) efflux system membrane fusion protein